MPLTNFEIAIGGITAIPTTTGLIFLAYKTWGEKRLDTSGLKPKKTASSASEQATKGNENRRTSALKNQQGEPSANQTTQPRSRDKTTQATAQQDNKKDNPGKPKGPHSPKRKTEATRRTKDQDTKNI